MLGKKLKPKPCSWCRVDYIRWNSTQDTCSIDCAIALVKHKQDTQLARTIKQAEKVKRKELKIRREKLKSRSDYEKEAQRECNAYIRERDKDEACISCGTTNPNIQYCAGHFKSVGSTPELRYHPSNIHKQCNYHCNSQKSGNIEKYRPELIKKIGLSQVEWLEKAHKVQNRTVDDLIEIKLYYREQKKLLVKSNGE